MEKPLNISGHRCQSLQYKASGTPIVFFHGLSYNVGIWQNIGVTDLLTEKHVPFLALDMPYGIKSQCQPKSRDPEKNLSFAKEALKTVFGDAVPAVVGASIGGNMALQYAAKYPVKGLFLVAPARALEPELASNFGKFNFPVTIIWGSLDSIIASEEMRTLSTKLPNAKLLIYEGAGHSAYRDQPDRFNRDLLEFYAKAES